jgi:solute carrier family 12 sodium/potassium/chloride transporter 2
MPKGSIKLLGIEPFLEQSKLVEELEDMSAAFRAKGVFSSSAVIHTDEFANGINYGNQALQGAFFRPNIMFLNYQNHDDYENELKPVMREAIRLEIGILLFVSHPKALLGQRKTINVWVSDRTGHWELSWNIGNLDLSILIAYKLKMNWGAKIRLITVVKSAEEEINATDFLNQLINLARLPDTLIEVHLGDFKTVVADAPPADLNIFGMDDTLAYTFLKDMTEKTGSSCLFVKDSGHESILA